MAVIRTETAKIDRLLSESAALEKELAEFLELPTYDQSERLISSKIMCSISFEHAESAKMLVATGNFTSATGLVRLQYESLVRAMWLLYSASESAISKLMCELTAESSHKANKLPMLSEMLENLETKAPPEALKLLLEVKEYSWKPLSSFVHGGIHAINRHSKGYPKPLLEQVIRISNGVSIMVGMLLVILHGGGQQIGKIPRVQQKYAACLPKQSYKHS